LFRPEFVLISAGFDSRRDDPLGQFTLSDQDFADLTKSVSRLAPKSAKGRVVSTLEGGYNVDALGRCVVEHVGTMLG
jgi:acetoin utilization deacetylase AcuC-like enzyme